MAEPVFFSAVAGSHVNREKKIIEGVSVITSGIEAEGHGLFIDGKTLKQMKACAVEFSDGVRVKVDHGTGFDSIVGSLRNFRIEGEKLLADLHLLGSNEMAERVMEIAEEMPASVGLSVAFSYTVEEIDGKNYARCEDLYSVDLVDRPAANPSGLFARVDSLNKVMAEATNEKTVVEQIKTLLGFGVQIPTPAAPVIPAPVVVNFEAKAKELETTLAAKDAELAELKATADKVKVEFAAKEAALADREKKLNDEIELKASARARDITAGQGQPPIVQAPAVNPAAPAKTELKGLKKTEAVFAAQFPTPKR